MPKNIVFCADGTCNGPGELDDLNHPDPTNVYKLFVELSATPPAAGAAQAAEQETQQTDATGAVEQAARYIDGVGDSDGPIMDLFGGAVGAGLAARIVRGFTFISRTYDPGDRIFLVGFSRGAYTVRALAGLILFNGLLDKNAYGLNTIPFGSAGYPANQQQAYQLGAGAWYQYQRTVAVNGGVLGDFDKFMVGFPGFFYTAPEHMVPVAGLQAIGVWDTVGSYGFSAAYDDSGEKTDLFPLANTRLNALVGRGFQAISLDEQRNVFTPILWDAATNVVQALFPGAHADVGGGYSIFKGEAHLSDIALAWMLARLTSQGLITYPGTPFPLMPDPAGIAHQQWLYPPWTGPGFTRAVRSFAGRSDITADPSIAARELAGTVVFDPGSNSVAPPVAPVTGIYRPANLP